MSMTVHPPLFDRPNWNRFMAGYMVRDCTIGFEDGRLGFLLFEELAPDAQMEDGFQIRLLAVKVGNPLETRFFSLSANALSVGANLSSAWSPLGEFVAVGIGRHVYGYRPKSHKGREEDIPFEVRRLAPSAYSECGCAILKTVRVGMTVFAVGGPFRIFQRIGPQEWQEHSEIPIPAELGSSDRETALAAINASSFEDLAGLSEEDMYAVGSRGALWRRHQGRWGRARFPSTRDLHTVAVAPDGTAYVTDHRGCVWKGKDSEWTQLVEADLSLPYQDSVWFKGRLYCTNDLAGCFVLEEGRMVAAHRTAHDPMPVRCALHAHRLDVSPDGGRLLVAGMSGASLYDGRQWHLLFDGEPDSD
ncbi:hypothetical protein [Roseateles amylovorans]|uniref:Uncharacterized protein n=1 Tax=Roseateles amylovorans TaxID=2978473 RepID=A0ABY6BAP2_9BURK|nr:hypothetical protein [Roseateles amylovorans]UXH80645.1 hypothetical protein N4261_12525 [Roseateles amylovorans]